MIENEIEEIVVVCSVRLHKDLGPGLLDPVYEVILAHHLKLTDKRLGCLLTFGGNLMKDGISRVLNGFVE